MGHTLILLLHHGYSEIGLNDKFYHEHRYDCIYHCFLHMKEKYLLLLVQTAHFIKHKTPRCWTAESIFCPLLNDCAVIGFIPDIRILVKVLQNSHSFYIQHWKIIWILEITNFCLIILFSNYLIAFHIPIKGNFLPLKSARLRTAEYEWHFILWLYKSDILLHTCTSLFLLHFIPVTSAKATY